MLGERVRDYRRRAGLTQEQLAQRVGTTQSVISAIEKGARTNVMTDTLDRLAAALGVPSSALVGETTATGNDPPPVDELRAVGWPEGRIALFVQDWPAWTPVQRQRQRDRVLALYAEYQALQADLEAAHHERNGEPPVAKGKARPALG